VPWVRIDDGFPEHPKVAMLSPGAIGLHVTALCYCNRNLTDGQVEKGIEKRLTSTTNVARYVNELVRRGLWRDEGDAWRIHDYLEYQPSREKVLEERAAAAERQRRAREKAAAKRAAQPDDQSNVTPMSRRDKGVSHGGVTP
jgi:hypothetical protein